MKILKVIKKILVFGLVTLGAMAVIGLFIPDEWVEETEGQTQEEQTYEVEEVSTEEKEKEVEEDLSTVFNTETVAWVVENSMKDYFDYVEVEANEETKSVNVKVTNDGTAIAFQQIKMGLADESDWDLVKESTDECVVTLLNKFKEEWNMEDLHISMQVLNDLDKENMLYMTLNGKTVYDALEQE